MTVVYTYLTQTTVLERPLYFRPSVILVVVIVVLLVSDFLVCTVLKFKILSLFGKDTRVIVSLLISD